EIQPAIFIEIFSIVLTNSNLEFPLPWCNYFMVRLRRRGKIIRIVIALLMIIAVYLRHPLVVPKYALLCFQLCLPGPIPVQVKIVMIEPSSWPWLTMLSCIAIGVGRFARYLGKPVYIPVTAIGVDIRIYDHHH